MIDRAKRRRADVFKLPFPREGRHVVSFFIIHMSHPDEAAWKRHVHEHIAYLRDLEGRGVLRASGKIVDAPVKTGCIIMTAKNRSEVECFIAGDPFAIHNLIEDLTIEEWDPFFGVFASESSQAIAGL